MNKLPALAFVIIAVAIAGCGGGGGGGTSTPKVTGPASVPTGTATATPTPGPNATATPTPTPSPAATATPLPQIPLGLNVNNLPGPGFYGEIVTQLSNVSPREMVMLPNGDLLFGTGGGTATSANSGAVYILPNAEATAPPAATVFATLTDTAAPCAGWAGNPNVNGITFAAGNNGGTIFVGMECSIWKIPYVTGDHTASSAPTLFAKVRTGPTSGQLNDSDIHHTTSVLAVGGTLYAGVGSSCNACTETDATRGSVLTFNIASGAQGTKAATRVRNALALAVNPATQAVWAGGAGQDCMVDDLGCFTAMDNNYQSGGHPYEWIDPITTRAGSPPDYQWPWCEENKTLLPTPDGTPNPITPSDGNTLAAPNGTSCTNMIVPPVRAPAYETIIGATFYSPPAGATYAFPSSFKGGLFLSLHGSWHENSSGIDVASPQVVFIPITAGTDNPANPMDWTNGGNPYSTWALGKSGNPAAFMNGFQSQGIRIGRPVGLAVGLQGSLFIADDTADMIYRIRPGTAPASIRRAVPASIPAKPATVPIKAPILPATAATTLPLPLGSTLRR